MAPSATSAAPMIPPITGRPVPASPMPLAETPPVAVAPEVPPVLPPVVPPADVLPVLGELPVLVPLLVVLPVLVCGVELPVLPLALPAVPTLPGLPVCGVEVPVLAGALPAVATLPGCPGGMGEVR